MAEIQAPSIANEAGTGPIELEFQAAFRAWFNYDQTGTPSVVDSLNISSVTDISTGSHTANFANSFADANYLALSSGARTGTGGTARPFPLTTGTVSALNNIFQDYSFALYDAEYNYCGVHGDLA